jgi:serine phosphatase RsbU (regulator of sigma subunit)
MKNSVFLAHFIFFGFLAFQLQFNVYAQKGYPFISAFTFHESIETDNFSLIQDNYQNILIANRKGVLTFDSRTWYLLPLPYFPVILAKSPSDGTLYAGCRNGFGRLEQDETGKYQYKLLSDTIFTGEISAIEILPGREYFIARNRIFYSTKESKEIKYWEFPYEYYISGSFVFQNDFYFMIREKGLYKAESDTFKLVLNDRLSTRTDLIFSCETDSKEILVGTDENELHTFNGYIFSQVKIQDSEYLRASIITDGKYLGNNKIAVGTMLGGVLICDYKTGVKSSIVNYKTGLPDDEIFCLGTDNNHGLWLCHTFGVSRIDNQLNAGNFTWYPGLNGNLTNSAFFKDQLYIGTSDGLYVLKEKREYTERLVFEKSTVPADREVYSPPDQSGTVPVISENNTPAEKESLSRREQRKIRRQQLSEKGSDPGSSANQEAQKADKNIELSKNTARITENKPEDAAFFASKKKIYSLQSIRYTYEKITGITGKCTEIFVIKDHLIVSTNYGLYDIYNDKVNLILPNTYISFVSSGPNDKLLFAVSEKSLYILLLNENRWEVVREFDALNYPVYSACMVSPTELWLGSINSAHKLTLDSYYFADNDETFPISADFSEKIIVKSINQKICFFLSSGIYCLEKNEIKPVKTFKDLSSFPEYFFSDNSVVWYRSSGQWNIFTDDATGTSFPDDYLNIFQSVQDIYMGKDGNLWIIANYHEVFQILKETDKMKSGSFSVFFSGLKGADNQLFSLIKPKISYQNSSLRIEFSAPYYIAPGKTEFSFKINKPGNDWSEWSNMSTIEYPFLPPGEYKIEAKARNIFGEESKVSQMEIVIKPPFWRTTFFYLLMFALIFALFVLILKFREQNLYNAKLLLENKVRERTVEIERQKNEIAGQKKEILDSIMYARRIQTAILPSTKMLNSVLSEHFVLFVPKDIVSGDFYWSTVKGDKIVILAADCTGHGVPGAFMSMLGVSLLNEIINAGKLNDAAAILNELRNDVKNTLAKSGNLEQARDGMDIALCIIDQKHMKLQFAGAYNPMYMVREGELTEFKGDKMPIGLYEINTGFTNNVLNIRKDDCFYIFSDGFIDQFGEETEKKFLSKPFKELLIKIHKQPMNKQKDNLTLAFEKWKGSLPQVDDVLVIGFRI